MKMQSIIMILVLSFTNIFLNAAEFSVITNETKYPIDVYDFTKLNAICFAGAQLVPGPDIYLSCETKPRVPAGCFTGGTLSLISIMPHETRQVASGMRVVLRCNKPSNSQYCWVCHLLGQSREIFSYQMIETKPSWHYVVRDPEIHHRRQ